MARIFKNRSCDGASDGGAGVTAGRWRFWLRLVQVAVTVGLLVLLIRSVDWPALPALLSGLQWEFLALSLSSALIIHLINVARWRYLLQSQMIGYGRLLVYYGGGLFSNNFLPTGIGGDGVRIALLRQDVPLARAALSVGLDRTISLLALSALLVPGLWFGLPPGLASLVDGRLISAGTWRGAVVLLVLAGVGLAGLCIPKLRQAIADLLARCGISAGTAGQTGGHWYRLLAGAYLLSFVSHLCLVALHWLVLRALLIDLPIEAAVWLVLITSASLVLPITVNGLGLLEGIYVVLLGSYGVQAAAAIGVGLLIRIVMLLFSLLGGLLLLGWNMRRAAGSESLPIDADRSPNTSPAPDVEIGGL